MAGESDGYGFPVDATSIMLFASAIGETNRIYYDEEYAASTPLGEVIAPPTFPIAAAHWNPRYPLRGVRRIPQAPERSEPVPSSGGDSAKQGGGGGALARGLHGEQRFEYAPGKFDTVELLGEADGTEPYLEAKQIGSIIEVMTLKRMRDRHGEFVAFALHGIDGDFRGLFSSESDEP